MAAADSQTAADLVDQPRSRSQLVWTLGVILLISLAGTLYAARRGHFHYILVIIASNYFQFGAVQRGLVGSVAYLTGLSLLGRAILVSIISPFILLATAYFALRRMPISAIARLPFMIVLGAVVLFWCVDIGRTDMLTSAILLLAALAVHESRLVVASICLVVGLAIHEVSFIYGLPLLAVILLGGGNWRSLDLRQATVAGTILVVGFLIYAVVPHLPHAEPATVVRIIRSEIPEIYQDKLTDWALYILVGGTKSIALNFCTRFDGFRFFIDPVVAAGIIALAVAALSDIRRFRWVGPALAGLLPMFLMWFAASDWARWVAFGIFNVWIVCALQNPRRSESETRWKLGRVICALALIPLIYPRPGSDNAIAAPSPLIEKFLDKALRPHVFKTADECDPGWRSLLTAP